MCFIYLIVKLQLFLEIVNRLECLNCIQLLLKFYINVNEFWNFEVCIEVFWDVEILIVVVKWEMGCFNISVYEELFFLIVCLDY